MGWGGGVIPNYRDRTDDLQIYSLALLPTELNSDLNTYLYKYYR